VTSGQTNGMGTDRQSQSANVTAKTTVEFQSGTVPAGFGALWAASAGANPYLTWQVAAAAPTPVVPDVVVPTVPPAADPGTMASTVTSTIQNFAAFYPINFWPAETAGTGACCGLFYKDKRFGP